MGRVGVGVVGQRRTTVTDELESMRQRAHDCAALPRGIILIGICDLLRGAFRPSGGLGDGWRGARHSVEALACAKPAQTQIEMMLQGDDAPASHRRSPAARDSDDGRPLPHQFS
jgi:hypothetical protein